MPPCFRTQEVISRTVHAAYIILVILRHLLSMHPFVKPMQTVSVVIMSLMCPGNCYSNLLISRQTLSYQGALSINK